jgi:hypothetical protein
MKIDRVITDRYKFSKRSKIKFLVFTFYENEIDSDDSGAGKGETNSTNLCAWFLYNFQ